MGVSFSVGTTEPAALGSLNGIQSGSALTYRSAAFTPWTEWAVGLGSRSQVLAPDRSYVFETSGLKLDGGLLLGPVRAGMGLELAWLRQILAEPGNTLRFHTGGGFIAEPYVGVMLPWPRLGDTTLELSVHYPLPQLKLDPALGPRVMLTLWADGDDEDAESAEPQGEDGPEEGADQPPPGAKPGRPVAKPAAPPARPGKSGPRR